MLPRHLHGALNCRQLQAAAVALVLAVAVPAASAAAPLCGTLDAPPPVWEHVVCPQSPPVCSSRGFA